MKIMEETHSNNAIKSQNKTGGNAWLNNIKRGWKYRALFIMLLPGIIYFLLFCYQPMYGVVLAFKDFTVTKGIMGSPWVGLKYFEQIFSSRYFLQTIVNTLLISTYKLFYGFPVPIIFALLMNELTSASFKKLVQTVSYLPFFMSWVILGSIFFSIFSLEGPVNAIIEGLGLTTIRFLGSVHLFRSVLVATDIWKNFGWAAIIYLAAFAGVDESIYEAARVDGANRFHTAVHVTLPSILPVISMYFILSLSGILNAGFDQVFNMYSISVYNVADIIDTYVYRLGLQSMEYSLATAVGLFKSVIGLVMILAANKLIKRISGKENALW